MTPGTMMLPWMMSGFALGSGEVAVLVPVSVDGGHNGARNFVELFADAGGGLRLPPWLFRFFEEVKEDRPRMKPSASLAGIEALHATLFMDKDMEWLCTERTLDQRFLALEIFIEAAFTHAPERMF
jgi:hypothetical protein